MRWVWRIAWHAGFGGTGTAETINPKQFIHQLYKTYERVDWVSIYGAYQTNKLPNNLDVICNGRPNNAT